MNTAQAFRPRGLVNALGGRDDKDAFRVGLVGAGEMGTDLITHFRLIRGMNLVALCDHSVPKAKQAVATAYADQDAAKVVSNVSALHRANESGHVAFVLMLRS